jgi:hypothetical protein
VRKRARNRECLTDSWKDNASRWHAILDCFVRTTLLRMRLHGVGDLFLLSYSSIIRNSLNSPLIPLGAINIGNGIYLEPFAIYLIFLHCREALDEHLGDSVAGIRYNSFFHTLPNLSALSKWLRSQQIVRTHFLGTSL